LTEFSFFSKVFSNFSIFLMPEMTGGSTKSVHSKALTRNINIDMKLVKYLFCIFIDYGKSKGRGAFVTMHRITANYSASPGSLHCGPEQD
jgi:hypothetical protein